jgi:hypothetical protein
MKAIIFALLLFSGMACKRKLSHADIEDQLKTSMHAFLIKRPNYDSSKLKYEVQKVYYFEEKDAYECEFVVHMWSIGKDTTGVMTATVSKDFSRVKRKL